MKRPIIGALVLLLPLAATSVAYGQAAPNVGQTSTGMPAILQNVGFKPELNSQMPLDLTFRDETGKTVQLSGYFHHQKPVVLAFVYYSCPMLCMQLEQGLVGSLRMISFNPGRDYDVVFVSFDDRDTPDIAAMKKQTALKQFRRPETASGWHFLTGQKDAIMAATQAARFTFNFDSKTNLFAHASGILLLTPEGRISRYFYGVEFPSRSLRLGLVDASEGRIGTPVDHALLFCFQYDPSEARYSASILRIMRLGGVLTVLCLVFGILIFRRRDHAKGASPNPAPHGSQGAR